MPNLRRISIEFRKDILRFDSGGRRAMPGQITRPIGSVLVSTLLISGLTVGMPATNARAVDCVSEPTNAAPKNSEWHYRTERAKHRKCWYLRAARASLQSLPAENSTAVHAGDNLSEKEREKLFREFENSAAHHAGDDLSEKEREKLFTEFLEWSRRPPD